MHSNILSYLQTFGRLRKAPKNNNWRVQPQAVTRRGGLTPAIISLGSSIPTLLPPIFRLTNFILFFPRNKQACPYALPSLGIWAHGVGCRLIGRPLLALPRVPHGPPEDRNHGDLWTPAAEGGHGDPWERIDRTEGTVGVQGWLRASKRAIKHTSE